MTILIEELTREAARQAYDAGATVILPTGSIEQHGPHLPVFTDTLLVTHVAREAARMLASPSLPGAPNEPVQPSGRHCEPLTTGFGNWPA